MFRYGGMAAGYSGLCERNKSAHCLQVRLVEMHGPGLLQHHPAPGIPATKLVHVHTAESSESSPSRCLYIELGN